MNKYIGYWKDGTTHMTTARNIAEAHSRFTGWAMLRSHHIQDHLNFKVKKVDTNFDTFFKHILFVIGCVGILIMLCVLRDNDAQLLTNAEFWLRGAIGIGMSAGAIGIYTLKYEKGRN